MSEDQFQLAVIIGSVREGRFGPTVARWFTSRAEQFNEAKVDVIDLAHTQNPGKSTAQACDTATDARSFADRIGEADAIVVITPEYNHGYPGPLKTAIDSLKPQWQAKAVGFVSYGGVSGGLRAVEQLRAVFAELRAVTIRETVSFHHAQARFDESGTPIDPDMVNKAADVLLRELAWWANALRKARAAQPYGH